MPSFIQPNDGSNVEVRSPRPFSGLAFRDRDVAGPHLLGRLVTTTRGGMPNAIGRLGDNANITRSQAQRTALHTIRRADPVEAPSGLASSAGRANGNPTSPRHSRERTKAPPQTDEMSWIETRTQKPEAVLSGFWCLVSGFWFPENAAHLQSIFTVKNPSPTTPGAQHPRPTESTEGVIDMHNREFRTRSWAVLVFLLLGAVQALSAGEFRPVQGNKIQGQYIVVFNDGTAASKVAQGLARSYGASADRVWEHALNGALFVGLQEAQARALANNPMVAWVEEDGEVKAIATQLSPPWGLDRIDQRLPALDSSYTYNFDGTGIHAYIIDTGIRDTHTQFGGRATRDYDSVGDGMAGWDCNGHGTHVAGTIGGTTYGVAKNVRVHAVRVLDCGGSGTFSGVIDGVNWVTANATRPAVANMSLSGSANTSLDTAVDNSVNSGIFYAVAAGNNAADACNISPARAAQAYAVAATDSADYRASFSNYGSCVDIFAPGVGVLSAWSSSDTATASLDGTSMASPHVAGAAVLVLQESPGSSSSQVRSTLNSRATTNAVFNAGTGSPNLLLYSLGWTGGVPATPASLTITPEYCFGFNWADWTASDGATRYELYISTSSSFTSQSLYYSGPGLSTDVRVTGTRYLRVRACNASGCSGYRNGNRTAIYYNGCL